MGQMNWGAYADEAAKSGGFEPLPTGVYNVRVETADLKDGKNDHKQILTKLVVIDGPLAGRSILNNMSPFKNDGDTNGFFTSQLASMGFGRQNNPAFWQQLEAMPTEEQGMGFIASSIVGCQVTITTDQRTHGGVLRDNVKGMKPMGAPMAGVPVAPGAPGTVVNIAPGAPIPAAAPAVAAPAAAPIPAAPAAAAAPAQAIAPAPVAAAPAPVAAAPVEAAPVAAQPAQAAPVAPVAPVVPAVPDVTAPVPVATATEMVRPDEAPF